MTSSRNSGGNRLQRIAAALLAAGMILSSCGCGQRSAGDAPGGRAPTAKERPAPTAAGKTAATRRVGGCGFGLAKSTRLKEMAARHRAAPDSAPVLTLEANSCEVALGGEVSVCERLAWEFLDDVESSDRSWEARRVTNVGEDAELPSAEIVQSAPTDTDLVVIGEKAELWGDCDFRGVQATPDPHHGGRKVEEQRKYRLRFTKAGWFEIVVDWSVLTFGGEDFSGREGIVLHVLKAGEKPRKRDGHRISISRAPGKDGRGQMIVEGGSANLSVLPADSGPIQEELKSGTWLVYFFDQSSLHDLLEMETASSAADSLRGTAKVAVREYVEYDDIRKLYPGFRGRRLTSPPLWVLLSKGKVLGDLTGPHRSDEIVAFVRKKLTGAK